MTLQEIQALLDYHYWARDRLLTALELLTHEQLTTDRGNSFSSIFDTLVHLYGAEWVWCSRWQGASPPALPATAAYPDLASLLEAWRDTEQQLRALVQRLGEEGIQRPIEYSGFDGRPQAQIFSQMFQHLVNHGSYHRGQITTMLRQLKAPPPRPMDLIAFYRERVST